MPNIQVQFRRGTDTEHSSFTGAEGEVTVDTTNDTLRVHDGSTAGGVRLAKHSELGTTIADGSVTPAKTDFDELTIEADSTSEGQGGIASLEIIGVSGALIDLSQDPEGDYDARLINQTQQTRLDSKDPVLIRTGTSQNTALNIHTDGKVQVGSSSTPAYALDVAGDVNVTGDFKVNGTNLSVTTPAGTVSAFAGSSAPTGYLLCDGDEYSETTYAALFAVLGSTYNTGGETANHFRVPDLRGRVVAGLDNMGGTSANRLTNPTSTANSIDGDGLGNTGGHETHTLLEAEMPSHTHSVPSSGSILRGDSASEAATDNAGTSGATGGDGAHNNVQPTIILNYIIKT